MSPPLPLFYGRVLRQQRMYSFGHFQSQAIIDSFKHCTLAVVTDCGEDLLIHCLKPNQPFAAGLDWLKGLYYIVLRERQSYLTTIWKKLNKHPP